MRPLDLWIEFIYDDRDVDAYLIDVDIDSEWTMRGVKYTINDTEWDFYKFPRLDVYAYLTGLYNVMVF